MSHPLITIFNMNKVARKEPFLFYYEGLTAHTFVLLKKVEEERNRVAAAYNTELISLRVLLDKYYNCLKGTLRETLLNVPNYKDSIAPTSLDGRYIFEDVSNTLVPLHYMAEIAGIKTPRCYHCFCFRAVEN